MSLTSDFPNQHHKPFNVIEMVLNGAILESLMLILTYERRPLMS